jgi:putative redox protein
MKTRTVKFRNDNGDTLTGLIDEPAGRPRAWALFAHCFTCTKNAKAAVNIARVLADHGYAVMRFDFTGLGQSEGDFSETNFSSNVSDLLAAVRYLGEEHDSPRLLIGHSLGGTAVLQAAAQLETVQAVATIGSPADPEHVARLFAGERERIEEEGEAEVDLGGRPFRIRKQLLDDLGRHDLPEVVGELRRALLILHSPVDTVVDVENATLLFTHAMHPKSFVSLDQADHLMSDEADSRYAGRVLAAWAAKYLGIDRPVLRLGADPGESVSRTGASGFRSDVSLSGHTLIADEPEDYGGTNMGPTPYDLLSGALATCTSMTIRMYADHKKLPVDSVTVSVSHDKIHAKDCEDCEQRDGRIDRFERELRVDGDLTEEQLERITEIADRCPVHRTLHGHIQVQTRLRR